jgi:Probable lipoprotein LpqN
VKRFAATLAAMAVALAFVVACGPKSPDFRSILPTTSSVAVTTTTTTAKPVPLSKYLESIGVAGQQAAPEELKDLTVTIPTPPDWSRATNPKIAPQTVMLSKGGKFPTARLVVFRLRGNFDAAEVIKHGNDDAQLFENFKQLNISMADYNGFPSSMIEGSYDIESTRLHSWNRIVIPTGSGPDKQRYLVQLTITSLADETVTQSNGIESIIHGFVVAAK